MAEFRKLPTQAELQQMLFMESMRTKTPQEIAQENLAKGTTIKPIPENVFQKMAGGARTAGEFVNRAGTAADVAKLFPGYTGQSTVNIPTSFNFAPKQAPTGEIIPGGLQTQPVQVNQLLKTIKPADVLGISGAERAYTDVGLGKAPQPLDVLDVAGLGAIGYGVGKTALKATKGVPVGLSIQEAKGLLETAPKSDIGFYSAVEQAALATPRKSGTGQAFLNDISKGQDVRADEIKWMGLDDFLKGKQNVTRQEVQDYIANNRVDVQEIKSTIPRLPGEEMPGDKGAFLPKFGQYTLPGGENYRELLLTMPSKKVGDAGAEDFYNNFVKTGGDKNWSELTQAEKNEYINSMPDVAKNAPTTQEYRSSHFDQPNILAHLRVNDRVDADGKKMLLIEEVQSDWHQAGRDKGYVSAEAKNAEKQFRDYSKELAAKYDLNPEQNLSMYATMKRMQPEEVAKYEQLQSAWSSSKGGVPDAPFKDTWYQLALKRAIQHAAENGYDRIGLTTGSQQAARFDLSKQLSRVAYQDGVLHGYDKSGALVMNRSVAPNELPDYVGKELGKTMAENAVKDAEIRNKISVARYEGRPESEINALRSQLDDVKTDYSGLDLQVGGEGMKKYYDEIYPKFLDKYGKKWGARVGDTKIRTQSDKQVQEDLDLLEQLGEDRSKFSDSGMARVRYIDITPEMKAGVSKGQPLFMAAPIGAGLLGSESMTPER
jgi:hypothetical protein